MNLLEIRDKLDVIDREIVELYQKRMELCGEVARDKIRTGKKVFDPVREAQKLDSVSAMVKTDFDKQAVRELYQQLMTLSRRLQFEILTEYGKTFDTGYRKGGPA
jgi:chorismate mutase/prephenate dehydratase